MKSPSQSCAYGETAFPIEAVMILPLSPEVIEILRCPKTRQPLEQVSESDLPTWKALAPNAETFLVTTDGRVAYPVEDGYPYLLLDRALEKPSH